MSSNSSNNRFDFAVMKFESMLKSDSIYFFDTEDFVEIINHYLEIGKILKAKKAIQVGLEQHPKDTDISILKVEIFVLENKYHKAMLLLSELEKADVCNPEIYIQKGAVFSKRKNHHQAIKMLEKALSCLDSDDEDSDIYSLLGMEYLFMEDHHTAKSYYIKCLEHDKEDYVALYNVIYCFDYLKDHRGAIMFLNNYLERNPYCEIAWHQLGIQYIYRDMKKEAISCFDFAIISDQYFIGAYLEKGKVLESMKRYDEAIENYKYTLKIEDQTAFTHYRIGLCFKALKEYTLALTHLKASIHENPLLDKAWFAIAELYFDLKKFQKAYDSVKEAIEINEDMEAYWLKYAELTFILGLKEEGIRALNRTLEFDNTQPDSYFVVSKMQLQSGNIHEVINLLNEALEVFENHPKLTYLLSIAYLMKADKRKGLLLMNKALHTDYDMHIYFREIYPHIFNLEEVKEIVYKLKK